MRPRELREDEKWTKPTRLYDDGRTVKFRRECEWRWPIEGCCVANATMKLGRRRLCRTHVRLTLEGRR